MELREQCGVPSTKRELTSATSLNEIAERCRCLIEASPDAIYVDRDEEIVFANPAMLQLVGATHLEEVLGRSPFEFIHPDFRESVRERSIHLLRVRGIVPRIEKKIVRLDGLVVDVESMAAIVPWEGTAAVQVVLRDISERKQYERALRESERRFHQLADSMPQIVWAARPDGVLDYHNKKFYERTGLTAERARRPDVWKDFLHPDDVAKTLSRWEQSVRTGEPFEMEYRYLDAKTGRYDWHLGRALPVRNESGTIVRWFGTCTDINHQKSSQLALAKIKKELSHSTEILEKEVKTRTDKLQASLQALEEFLYTIAHNLRAPLRAMQGFTTALLEDCEKSVDETAREYARRIHKAAGTMDQLIHDLLSYGRLTHQEFRIGPLDLEPVVRSIITEFQPDIKSSKGIVALGKLNFRLQANPIILKQIISNLLSNSLKFCKPNTPPRIQIFAQKKDGKIVIHFNDNGIGIAPSHQARIFAPFERLHTEIVPGTGIGLAIAARGVEILSGRIGVKSKAGEGSSFWIEIPESP